MEAWTGLLVEERAEEVRWMGRQTLAGGLSVARDEEGTDTGWVRPRRAPERGSAEGSRRAG